mmetsp:Transcript_15316/g.26537  ORF Transcript_15316/g.26537 Transcript_15316/m.26537 type:complete len:88 (-) Transcript_15316:1179-1442(-)
MICKHCCLLNQHISTGSKHACTKHVVHWREAELTGPATRKNKCMLHREWKHARKRGDTKYEDQRCPELGKSTDISPHMSRLLGNHLR